MVVGTNCKGGGDQAHNALLTSFDLMLSEALAEAVPTL